MRRPPSRRRRGARRPGPGGDPARRRDLRGRDPAGKAPGGCCPRRPGRRGPRNRRPSLLDRGRRPPRRRTGRDRRGPRHHLDGRCCRGLPEPGGVLAAGARGRRPEGAPRPRHGGIAAHRPAADLAGRDPRRRASRRPCRPRRRPGAHRPAHAPGAGHRAHQGPRVRRGGTPRRRRDQRAPPARGALRAAQAVAGDPALRLWHRSRPRGRGPARHDPVGGQPRDAAGRRRRGAAPVRSGGPTRPGPDARRGGDPCPTARHGRRRGARRGPRQPPLGSGPDQRHRRRGGRDPGLRPPDREHRGAGLQGERQPGLDRPPGRHPRRGHGRRLAAGLAGAVGSRRGRAGRRDLRSGPALPDRVGAGTRPGCHPPSVVAGTARSWRR